MVRLNYKKNSNIKDKSTIITTSSFICRWSVNKKKIVEQASTETEYRAYFISKQKIIKKTSKIWRIC